MAGRNSAEHLATPEGELRPAEERERPMNQATRSSEMAAFEQLAGDVRRHGTAYAKRSGVRRLEHDWFRLWLLPDAGLFLQLDGERNELRLKRGSGEFMLERGFAGDVIEVVGIDWPAARAVYVSPDRLAAIRRAVVATLAGEAVDLPAAA
jgi:hypothetical protein